MTFKQLAGRISNIAGDPKTFGIAVGLILVWACLGPVMKYSQTWQLTVNTGTTIVTFLMVFLLQSSQNQDTKEIQLKLDELIRANEKARNRFAHLEDATEEELKSLHEQFKKLREGCDD